MTSRRFRVALTVALTMALTVVLAEPAQAAVSVSRAEVSGNRLRIDGTAVASRPITVDGVQMATSSSSGSFKIDRSGYTRPADCTVDVNDGSAAALNVRLSGCTPTSSSSAALNSVSLNPASVPGGTTAAGTVTLSAPAPSGGAVVTLSSTNTAVVTVPATMTVPAGVDSNVTVLSTSPVTSTATSVISATYNGVTRTATMTVTAPPPQPTAALDLIVLNPSTVQTGTTRTSATVYFTALTPSGGAAVTLSSSDGSIATVPPSITVPAMSSSGAFDVTINSSASGSTTISATYNGVVRSALLTVSAQSLFRIITVSPLPNARVGENYAGFIEACCGQGGPYTWSLMSGAVPDGLKFAGNDLQLSRTTGVTGVATQVQTTTFTVRATDDAGNTATKSFSLTVDPASPLVITNVGDQLPDGKVGVAYETGVFPGGGVPPYQWSHVAGTLPPGLSVQASPGRVKGTPAAAGSFTFTLRVDDSSGQFTTRQFSILVAP